VLTNSEYLDGVDIACPLVGVEINILLTKCVEPKEVELLSLARD
jgi:hypothetical protein